MSEKELLTISEVMTILKVSRSTVNKMIKDNKIQTIKLGDKKQSAIRIKRDSLNDFLSK